MMLRAMRLRDPITRYCNIFSYAVPFSLSDSEWLQVGYLIDIVRPFNFFTSTVGKTRDVTLPYALPIYDELFERLTECRRRLNAKIHRYPWAQQLIDGIDAAEEKLDSYYNKTYSNLGSFYGIGALLNPAYKSKVFNKQYCWLDFEQQDWETEFEEQFENLFEQSYAGNQEEPNTQATRLQALRHTNINPLAAALERSRSNRMLLLRAQPLDLDDEDDTSVSNVSEARQWLSNSQFFSTNLYTNQYWSNILQRLTPVHLCLCGKS